MRRVFAGLAIVAVLAVAGEGCASRRKAKQEVELLTAEDLYRQGLASLQERKLRQARGYLERIQFSAQNRPELEPLVRLALADATFYAGDDLSLIEARSKYLDFVTLYGDHPQAPYAQFQAGVASLEQVSDPSRDQSQTQVALADLREVTRRWPTGPYAEAAQQMVGVAQGHLAEHEFLVARFYAKRKRYQAASDRLRGLLETYPRYAHKDQVYLLLGQALVKMNSTAEGRVYLDKLLADYPASEAAKEARKLLADLADGQEGRAGTEPGTTAG
jgi:outer membrane protein assembly factor BamD